VLNGHLTAALTGLLTADVRPATHPSQHCSPAGPRCGRRLLARRLEVEADPGPAFRDLPEGGHGSPDLKRPAHGWTPVLPRGVSRLRKELQLARLGVILALPHGYDTEVGERGALLSAGERQLVVFARAWLADPALLILDEATSNLDVATETRVTEAMRRLRQGRTTIVIAHRLSTVIEADQIAVIEDGRVVEAGPPDQLLARGGQFADLYDRWLAGAA
jgi:hypothetical protein